MVPSGSVAALKSYVQSPDKVPESAPTAEISLVFTRRRRQTLQFVMRVHKEQPQPSSSRLLSDTTKSERGEHKIPVIKTPGVLSLVVTFAIPLEWWRSGVEV
jgi:hypothetical protein